MIPPSILEAQAHPLPIGAHAGSALAALDDATLAQVVMYYRPRDFLEWRAAYIVTNARAAQAAGLDLERPETWLARRDEPGDVGKAARWFSEYFGGQQ